MKRVAVRKEDIRTIRTKNDLATALASLLNQRSLHAITVPDITEEALVSKNTFYTHFRSKEALAAFYISRELAPLTESLDKLFQEVKKARRLLKRSVRVAMDFVDERKETYRLMFAHDKYRLLEREIREVVFLRLKERQEKYGYLSANENLLRYYANVYVELAYRLLTEDKKVRKKKLAKEVRRFSAPLFDL